MKVSTYHGMYSNRALSCVTLIQNIIKYYALFGTPFTDQAVKIVWPPSK